MLAPKMKPKKISTLQNKRKKRIKAKQIRSIELDQLREEFAYHQKDPVFLMTGRSKLRIPQEKVLSIIEMLQVKDDNQGEVLTTQEVADLLNVSRPFVIKLIDQKELPLAFMAGNQRRILKSAALEYRDKIRLKQSEALEKLTRESEDLELGF